MVDSDPTQESVEEIAERLQSALFRVARDGGGGAELVGAGECEIYAALRSLEEVTTRSVWSSRPQSVFVPTDEGVELNERSRARGVELVTIVTERALQADPLLTSIVDDVRIGPAMIQMILVDDETAIIEGPRTAAGESTAWRADEGEVLALARDYMSALRRESVSALPPGAPRPLTARQVVTARLMCVGTTDAAIARSLGISTRSVERDVAVILRSLGAVARTDAVARMIGGVASSSARGV